MRQGTIDEARVDQELKVADSYARGYVDPSITISPEENKRLLRKIYIRQVSFRLVQTADGPSDSSL